MEKELLEVRNNKTSQLVLTKEEKEFIMQMRKFKTKENLHIIAQDQFKQLIDMAPSLETFLKDFKWGYKITKEKPKKEEQIDFLMDMKTYELDVRNWFGFLGTHQLRSSITLKKQEVEISTEIYLTNGTNVYLKADILNDRVFHVTMYNRVVTFEGFARSLDYYVNEFTPFNLQGITNHFLERIKRACGKNIHEFEKEQTYYREEIKHLEDEKADNHKNIETISKLLDANL